MQRTKVCPCIPPEILWKLMTPEQQQDHLVATHVLGVGVSQSPIQQTPISSVSPVTLPASPVLERHAALSAEKWEQVASSIFNASSTSSIRKDSPQ